MGDKKYIENLKGRGHLAALGIDGTTMLKLLVGVRVSRPYDADDRMFNEYGAVGGMRIGRGNRSTRT
jgi:hypothetical protein